MFGELCRARTTTRARPTIMLLHLFALFPPSGMLNLDGSESQIRFNNRASLHAECV